MAADAHGVVVARAGADQRLVAQVGNRDIPRAYFDGALAGHCQECVDGRQVRVIGADVDQAEVGAGKYRGATGKARRHKGFYSSFHVGLSEPHSDTGDETRLFDVPAFIAHQVGGIAIGAIPGNADVGRELADDLVTQAQSQLGVGEP
ncbi:hypothetical protein D9M68_698520 [compost metagenome]